MPLIVRLSRRQGTARSIVPPFERPKAEGRTLGGIAPPSRTRTMNRKTIAELAEVLHGLASETMNSGQAAKRLRGIARRLAADAPVNPANVALLPQPEPEPEPEPDSLDIVQALFAYWKRTSGHETARLTPERVRVLRARLRQGYKPQDIQLAIDGCVASDFHAEGGYDDLTLICRNGSKLEQFIEKAGATPAEPLQQTENAELTRLKSEMREARDAGDTERWRELNERVRTVSAAHR